MRFILIGFSYWLSIITIVIFDNAQTYKIIIYRHVNWNTYASNDKAASRRHGDKMKYERIKGKVINKQHLKST